MSKKELEGISKEFLVDLVVMDMEGVLDYFKAEPPEDKDEYWQAMYYKGKYELAADALKRRIKWWSTYFTESTETADDFDENERLKVI